LVGDTVGDIVNFVGDPVGWIVVGCLVGSFVGIKEVDGLTVGLSVLVGTTTIAILVSYSSTVSSVSLHNRYKNVVSCPLNSLISPDSNNCNPLISIPVTLGHPTYASPHAKKLYRPINDDGNILNDTMGIPY
jgi:hypothetical protein